MAWSLDGRPVPRILVSRLRYLGDVVMSTVVLEILRLGDPDLHLGYLCEAEHGGVLAGHPLVDRCHLLNSRRSGADEAARARNLGARDGTSALGVWGTVRELRAEKYDLAVDLFFNPRSAWLLRFGGAKRRIGGTLGSRRHLFTHTARPEDLTPAETLGTPLAQGGLGHHLSRLAPLVHAETGLGFCQWLRTHGPAVMRPRIIAPELTSATRTALADLGFDPAQPYVLLAPGATWPSKEWPSARWMDLARHLQDIQDAQLAVLVPPGRGRDWDDLGTVVRGGRGTVLPPLPLAQALALVAGADTLVSVDGGIMHAGVGLGTPTVGIFGPTDPALWFPYAGAGPFRVVAMRPECHPCDHHRCEVFICLPDLAAASVAEAVAEVRAAGHSGG